MPGTLCCIQETQTSRSFAANRKCVSAVGGSSSSSSSSTHTDFKRIQVCCFCLIREHYDSMKERTNKAKHTFFGNKLTRNSFIPQPCQLQHPQQEGLAWLLLRRKKSLPLHGIEPRFSDGAVGCRGSTMTDLSGPQRVYKTYTFTGQVIHLSYH